MIISPTNMSVSKSLFTELAQPSFFDIPSPISGLAELAGDVIKNQRKLEAQAAKAAKAPLDNIRSVFEDARKSAFASMDVAKEIEERAMKQARAVTQTTSKHVRKSIKAKDVDFDELMGDCVNEPEFIEYYDHA